MGQNGFEVSMVSSDFEGKAELEHAEQAQFIPVHMTRTISPWQDLLSLKSLAQLFKKLKPTIVHTHTPKAGLLGMMAAKITGVPIRLHTVAGLPLMEATGLKRLVLNQVEKLTYACATKVYPNSKNLAKFILDEGFTNPNKLKVIGNGSSNGINVTIFSKTDVVMAAAKELALKHQIKETDFTFVFVGRLVKDKGIEELVLAFDRLAKKYPTLKLLLVGPEEKELDALSQTCLALIAGNPAIIAVGYQNDVRPYFALSKVLAFPSYREGFPNVPMQAGCFDLPCIVSNINGCNEIIVPSENGIIIPVKDTIALETAMEQLYLNQELYASMSAKARAMIVDRYAQEKVWALILAEYKAHLKEQGIE